MRRRPAQPLIQIRKEIKKNMEFPCKDCCNYDRCLAIADEITDRTVISPNIEDGYIMFRDEFIESNEPELTYDILTRLQEICNKIKDYFPFETISRDFILVYPVDKKVSITEEEWDDRQEQFFVIWDIYKMIDRLLPEQEQLV